VTGVQTCALPILAQTFAQKGFRAIIFGDCEKEEGNYDGVEYIHYTKFDNFKNTNYIDYFISSRKVSPLANKIRNGKNYVWSHDIFIPECMYQQPPLLNKINKFVCLSPWHLNFFSEHHHVDKNQIYIQGNGLDLSRYNDINKIEKDPYRLIYSSSPDRGLLTLLQMFSGWKTKFPQINLHIYYGFDNWEKAIKVRGDQTEIKHLNDIKKLMKQDGVYYHGRVSQQQLAVEQMKSSLWVYPTQFTETFCITGIETMLAGAVPICTTVAALETTIPDDCGIKVKQPWDCSDAVIKLLNNPEQLVKFRQRGRDHVLKNYGWETVANNWIEMFQNT